MRCRTPPGTDAMDIIVPENVNCNGKERGTAIYAPQPRIGRA